MFFSLSQIRIRNGSTDTKAVGQADELTDKMHKTISRESSFQEQMAVSKNGHSDFNEDDNGGSEAN